MKKLKKAKDKTSDLFKVDWLKDPIPYSQFEQLVNFYKPWRKGHVRWFDKSSGEGMIRLDEGPLKDASIYVHGSAFGGDVNFGQNTNFEAKENMPLLVKVWVDPNYLMISKMKAVSTQKNPKSEVSDLLIVLNSTNDLGFKYPIGNKELTSKIKTLEAAGKIHYDEHFKRWKKGTKKNPKSNKWVILDWAGNYAFDKMGYQGSGHLHGPSRTFDSFDDAEEFLTEKLGENYDTDRGEYEIIEIGETSWGKRRKNPSKREKQTKVNVHYRGFKANPAGTVQLHPTFQPNIYHVSFDKLPKKAQSILKNTEPVIIKNRYTVYEKTAFIRNKVEVNGKLWDAEINLGSVDIKNWDYQYDDSEDAYLDDQGRIVDPDEHAKFVTDTLMAQMEWGPQDVYLTLIGETSGGKRRKNPSNDKSALRYYYEQYALAVRKSNWKAAVDHAKNYNAVLKRMGGPKKNLGESYLTMGKPGYKLKNNPQRPSLLKKIKVLPKDRKAVSAKIKKLIREGKTQVQAVAIALNMYKKKQVGPRGGKARK